MITHVKLHKSLMTIIGDVPIPNVFLTSLERAYQHIFLRCSSFSSQVCLTRSVRCSLQSDIRTRTYTLALSANSWCVILPDPQDMDIEEHAMSQCISYSRDNQEIRSVPCFDRMQSRNRQKSQSYPSVRAEVNVTQQHRQLFTTNHAIQTDFCQ